MKLDPALLGLLRAGDAYIKTQGARWASARPRARRASSLVAIGEALLTDELHVQQQHAWGMAIVDLGRAVAKVGPSACADLDAIAAAWLTIARDEGHVALERAVDPYVALVRGFGAAGEGALHAWLYGYAWLASDESSSLGPCDRRFVDAVRARPMDLGRFRALDHAMLRRLAVRPGLPFSPLEPEPARDRARLGPFATVLV